MHRLSIWLFAVFSLVTCRPAECKAKRSATWSDFQVISYSVRLRLVIASKRIEGIETVTIRGLQHGVRRLKFNARRLMILSVQDSQRKLKFEHSKGAVMVTLAAPLLANQVISLTFHYRGRPTRGIRWSQGQVVASFHTAHWMICVDEPWARAKFTLMVRSELDQQVYGPGVVRNRQVGTNQLLWTLRLNVPHSPYLYGFVIGRFKQSAMTVRGKTITLASAIHSSVEIRRLLRLFPPMIRFFESRSGVRLPNPRFTVVLVRGRAAQEIAQGALISARYGNQLLKNPREDWLFAHELAHQWWGNRITNQSWTHFWLHEGLVTFMTAAWKRHRWGVSAYKRELRLFRKRVKRAQNRGADRPLRFTKWKTSADAGGPIPYYKGALVLDQLRRHMGDHRFWRGIRRFSRRYLDRLVTTRNFQDAMGLGDRQKMALFFNKNVY